MPVSEEQIINALRTVQDPDLHKDLVTLGMVEDVKVDGKNISFTVVLTTAACPLKEKIKEDCVDAVKEAVDADAVVNVNLISRTTSRRDPSETLLPGVKNIICVASGKGGVGKSTVSVNLALGLAANGAKVGLIDADIYGPSIPTMMNLKGARPSVKFVDEKHFILPVEQYGIKLLSIGFLVDERQAIVWRGPMVSSALRQFVTDCIWGELDYMIIDLPPGTGDIHLTVVQTIPVTGAIIVTTPQDVALADARKAIAMFQLPQIKVPVIGIVENMSYFTPEELPENKYYLFGKGGGAKLAEESNVPLLGEVPLVQGIREGGDDGLPVILRENHPAGEIFKELAANSARQVAIRNASIESSKKVEVVS